ncbi:MAG: hypothetical protein ACTSYA_05170 [Candidatus Kariarchaeaceae archaeon]
MSFEGLKKVISIRSELEVLLDEDMLQLFSQVTAPDNILPKGMKLNALLEDNTWKLIISGSFSLGRLKTTWDEIIQHLILISQCNNLNQKPSANI